MTTNSGGHLNIPKEFWMSFAIGQFADIIDRGYLNKEECTQLWQMINRQNPPERIYLKDVYVRERDFQALIEAAKTP